ncbi:Protein of unknown function [Escherichia coli D6-113.11]
MGDQA